MNRREFMARLEELLQDISQRERVEALAYYNDYFDDAGVENEQQVISSLGSPEKVAATIKEELGEKPREQDGNSIIKTGETRKSAPSAGVDWGKVILIALICLVLSPILFPLGAALVSIIIAIPASFFGVLVAVGLGGIALVFAGIIVAFVALVKLFTSAITGVCLLGVGLLLLGIGILAIVATVWIAARVIPWVIRTIVRLIRMPFERKGGQAA